MSIVIQLEDKYTIVPYGIIEGVSYGGLMEVSSRLHVCKDKIKHGRISNYIG